MGIPLETLSKMFKGMIVIFAAVLTAATAKEAKAFSLFNVVTFNNDACTSTSITTQSGPKSASVLQLKNVRQRVALPLVVVQWDLVLVVCLLNKLVVDKLITIALIFRMTVSPLLSQEPQQLLSQTVTIKSTKLKQMCAVRDLTSLPSTLRLVMPLFSRLQSGTVLELAVTHLASSRIPMEQQSPLSFVVKMMDNTCILISDLQKLPLLPLDLHLWHLRQQDLGKSK